MMERAERTLVAWCPDWPVIAAGVALDQPAIVVHANRVACSPAARAEGVVEGLRRRRDAQGRCPQAELLAHDPARGARAYEPAVAALDVLCPQVEITRPGSCWPPPVPPATTAATTPWPNGGCRAQRALQGTAPVHVGIADGMLAATAAARQADRARRWSSPRRAGGVPRLVAGHHPGRGGRRRGGRPARGPHGRDRRRAGRLGLRTFGSLADVPAGDVLARFGTEGAVLRRLAHGLDARPLAARHRPPTWRSPSSSTRRSSGSTRRPSWPSAWPTSCTRSWAAAVWPAPGWRWPPRPSTGRPSSGAGATRGPSARRRWPSGSAGSSTGGCRGRPRRPAGISQLTLRPRRWWRPAADSSGSGAETLLDERAARALARVAGLLGAEAVRVPERRGGRGPGEQLTMVPSMAVDLVGSRPAAGQGGSPTPGPAACRRRHRLVHPDAPPVELVDGTGRLVGVSGRGSISSTPETLVAGGTTHRVVAWAGPWPADERWWRDRGTMPGPGPGGHRRGRPPPHRRRWPLDLEATYD